MCPDAPCCTSNLILAPNYLKRSGLKHRQNSKDFRHKKLEVLRPVCGSCKQHNSEGEVRNALLLRQTTIHS